MFANMDGLYKSPEIIIHLTCRGMGLITLTNTVGHFPHICVWQALFPRYCLGRLLGCDNKPMQVFFDQSILFSYYFLLTTVITCLSGAQQLTVIYSVYVVVVAVVCYPSEDKHLQ